MAIVSRKVGGLGGAVSASFVSSPSAPNPSRSINGGPSLTSEIIGKLGGGSLEWKTEEFPRRTLAWDGEPDIEYFYPPTEKALIAYAEVEVFSGGTFNTTAGITSEVRAGYIPSLQSNVVLWDTGLFRTKIVGIEEEESNKTLKTEISMDYQSPNLTYQFRIHWAEITEE